MKPSFSKRYVKGIEAAVIAHREMPEAFIWREVLKLAVNQRHLKASSCSHPRYDVIDCCVSQEALDDINDTTGECGTSAIW